MEKISPSTISLKNLFLGILVAIVIYNGFVTYSVRTYALNTLSQVQANSQRLVAVNNVMTQLFAPADQQGEEPTQ